MCETWNKAFAVLVGHNHPSVLTAVEAFQSDLAVVEQVMEQDARGQPPVKRVKRSTELLQKVFANCAKHVAPVERLL